MPRKIIGFCGYASAGKDEAAKALVERGFTRRAFADRLKEKVSDMLLTDLESINGNKELFRPLLVEIGKVGRAINPNYWVDYVQTELVAFNGGNYVITDVRYPNEVQMILDHGGVVYFIDRPGVGPANSEEAASINDIMHKYQLPVIYNDGNIDKLHNEVRKRSM